jgi:D-alanyl-D-alanine carboxypeptidase (penicillin-binding protein 5/6)
VAVWLVAWAGLAAPASAAAARTAARPVPAPRLSVSGASLIDAATGRRLFGVNANRELPIASTTKLMTALITLQHVHHLGTIFAQNNWRPAPDDSQIGLVPGERMSVHDLLVALLLPSADDAAEDLAYNVGHHSVSRFVAMMNAEARALHLKRTHYTTPIGLDTPGNYSTPTDLDLLAAYDLHHSAFFRRVVGMASATLHTGSHPRYVVNRNDLVGRYWWINGVKSGHTSAAGYVLVVSATRWGMTLIGSVLGTSSELSRDNNALALLKYGFSAFHLDRAIRSGQVLARLPEQYSTHRAPVIALHPFKYVVAKTTRVRVVLHLPKLLAGPMSRHAVVGQALIFAGRRRIGRVRLILARAVPAATPPTKAALLPGRPFRLLLLMLVCSGVLARSATRRVRRAQLAHALKREADAV